MQITYRARLKSSPSEVVRSGKMNSAMAQSGEWIRFNGNWFQIVGVFWEPRDVDHGDVDGIDVDTLNRIDICNIVVERNDNGPDFLS